MVSMTVSLAGLIYMCIYVYVYICIHIATVHYTILLYSAFLDVGFMVSGLFAW